MHAEGRGITAPSPVIVGLDQKQLQLAKCVGQRWAIRDMETRPDMWGKGFRPDAHQIGKLAEFAVYNFFTEKFKLNVSEPPSVEDFRNGDGGVDLRVEGLSMQVKGASLAFPTLLIRRIDENHQLVPLHGLYWVFYDTRDVGEKVKLMGWMTKSELRYYGDRRPGKARASSHQNIEVPRDRLHHMDELGYMLKGLKTCS